MFLRFSKGRYIQDDLRLYRKCVFLGDAVVMEYGDRIVGAAKLSKESNKSYLYNVVVAKGCELGAERIARFIKDMIGKSNKFTINPSTKRRRYHVEEIDCEELPISARIVFSRNTDKESKN